MKASNKQQPTRRNTPPPKKKQKSSSEKLATVLAILALGIGVIVAIAALLPSVASFFNEKQEKEQLVTVQKEMSEYLAKKYNEDFTVATPEFKGHMLGGPEVWETTAHPQKKPDLSFKVSSNNVGVEPNQTYHDYYMNAIWTHEQNPAFQRKVKEAYGDVSSVTASSSVSITQPSLLLSAIKNNPTYEDAVRNHSNDLRYKITIRSENIEEGTVYEDIAHAHSLVRWARGQGYKDVRLDYTAVESSGKEYQCETSTPPDVISKTFADTCFSKKESAK